MTCDVFQLLDSYIMSSREQSLNTAACRLLLNILPGVETAVIFQEKEGLVERLMDWARGAERPLSVYATGLLARAMSIQEVAAGFRDQNSQLVLVCRYFEAHLAVKVEQVKHSDGLVVPQQPVSKACTYPREQVIEMMEFLLECGPPQLRWEPVEMFSRLGCVPLMLQLISAACDWRNYYGRNDTVRYALDLLAILMLLPKVQLVLAATVEILDENNSPVSTPGQ
eukprot:XP_011619357.1 PREDICTED: protein VPRBP-like [Takifugu rubripes]